MQEFIIFVPNLNFERKRSFGFDNNFEKGYANKMKINERNKRKRNKC